MLPSLRSDEQKRFSRIPFNLQKNLTCNGQMLDEKVHSGLSTLVDQQSHQDSRVSKDYDGEQYP